jgi:CHAT domain-containing protein
MSFEEGLLVGYLPGFLSGLVCAGANRRAELRMENGLLTAEEVAWLDLRACDLVVLSACQTGLGESRSGEGMMSLRRSFSQAGARTVVSSLWRVRDDSTRDLMRRFYERRWARGEGKLEALRGAQLEVLAANREKFGDPLPATWGAFVLTGDWR